MQRMKNATKDGCCRSVKRQYRPHNDRHRWRYTL